MADEDFDADFDAGFGSTPAATQAPQAADPADTPEVAKEPAPAGAEETKVDEAPEYVQLTKQEYDDFNARLARFDEASAKSKQQIESAFGKLGSMQQVVDQLKASTAAGVQVQVSEEDFAELAEEYPELAKLTLKGLNNALSKSSAKGTQPVPPQAAPASVVDPAAVEQLVQQRLEASERSREMRRFERVHPDWKDVVKTQEYQTWLKTQPAQIQKDAVESWDADVTIPILASFKESKTATPATNAPSARQQRIASAQTPKGTGGHATAKSDDDEFLAGFNSA